MHDYLVESFKISTADLHQIGVISALILHCANYTEVLSIGKPLSSLGVVNN
jgi:hypothetical protein